ncbi:MAG: methyltransferase domain-containing protein [Candidatus Lokiarchaeota archaeon]|nr:methyltransferase domain-containing protein [Candidatus Lokiarchaeota archaeon]
MVLRRNYFKHLKIIMVVRKRMNHNKKNHKSNLDFKIMSFFFKIRDFFKDPNKKIEKIGLNEGDYVLEYGCGPGSFTIPIAKKVGASGKVFAADTHPLASEKIKKRANKYDMNNIETIITDCKTDLEEKSIDKVVLIDVLHDLSKYQENLKEFYRILKNDGNLWVDDHHFDEEEIILRVTTNDLFEYIGNIDSLFEFKKKSR